MNDLTPNVRLKSIVLENFKNVKYGSVSFENPHKNYKASVLGIYGQNGSGKTALIESIALLSHILCGRSLPLKYADYINVDAKSSCITYELSAKDLAQNGEYHIKYQVCLNKECAVEDNWQTAKPIIFSEVLSFSYHADDVNYIMQPLIDTRQGDVFGPNSKYKILTNNNDKQKTDLLVIKKLANTTSKSFIFSTEFREHIRKFCKNLIFKNVIELPANFARMCLFVIETKDSSRVSQDTLFLSMRYETRTEHSRQTLIGETSFDLDNPTTIHESMVGIFVCMIENMNVVLRQLVPGLTIAVKNLGRQLMKNGETGCVVELVSKKNGKEIPLKYESEGIKKIISILQLLIVMYNNPNITVVIDELDSGIFEYLLGEILRIVSEQGKGQLIFTSHNLRPLETIDKGFIAFTTTNPENRYIRMTNVKTNNNLRDFYYRDIMLGEQAEPIYDSTNNSEIAFAFRRAGDMGGS